MATQKGGRGTKGQQASAPAPAKKSRRVFPVGQCHHRDANGNPDCTAKIVAKRANLCPPHESVWQKAARARYAANRAAAGQTQPTTTKSTRAPKVTAETESTETPVADESAGEDLEAQLAASVSAFATPELAAKARAKRQAQRTQR